MKLELKHLSGYLPYNLILKSVKSGIIVTLDAYNINEYGKNLYMPILRPISDLYEKSFEENSELFIVLLFKKIVCEAEFDFLNALREDKCTNVDKLQYAPYSIILQLLEWDFDVFGLIEKGLAIDINKLEK